MTDVVTAIAEGLNERKAAKEENQPAKEKPAATEEKPAE